MQAALATTEPQAPEPSSLKLVLWVVYTGIGGGEMRSANLYDPPLDRALRSILHELGVHAGDVGLVRCDDAREPPCLKGAIAVATRQEGRRWPLAYITAPIGVLDLPALQAAFRRIGGQSVGDLA